MTDLRGWPPPLKLMVTLTLIFLLAGYSLSLILEVQRTGGRPAGFADYLRGDGEFSPPMEASTMLATTHPHLAAVPLMLAALSLPFLLGRKAGNGEKAGIVVLMFGGLGLSMASHWLVRYLGPAWYPAFAVGGGALTLSCFWAPIRSLHEMWSKGRRPSPPEPAGKSD